MRQVNSVWFLRIFYLQFKKGNSEADIITVCICDIFYIKPIHIYICKSFSSRWNKQLIYYAKVKTIIYWYVCMFAD